MKHTKSKNTERGIINPNGIIIEGDIALSTKYQAGNDRMLLLRTMICILASAFTMSILGKYIGSETITVLPVLLTALSFTALSTKSFAMKIYGIGYLIFQITYFIIMFNEIITGIELALLKYEKRADLSIFKSIRNDIDRLHLKAEDVEYYMFHGMMFIAAAVTVLVALSCIIRTDFPIFFISTFPFLEIGLFFGWSPPGIAAAGLVICWITMLSLSMLNHSTNKAGTNNTFAVHRRKESFYFTSRKFKNRFFTGLIITSALVCAVIFAVPMLFSAATGYVRPKAFDTLRNKITSFANDLPNKIDDMFNDFFNSPKTVGVTNGGKLGTRDEIKFNDDPVLDIQISKRPNATLYLRGFVAGDYSDNEWDPISPEISDMDKLNEAFSKYAGDQPIQNFNHFAIQSHKINDTKSLQNSIISFYNISADKRFIYAPYMTDYQSQNMKERSDAKGEGSVKQIKSTYMMDFYDMSDIAGSWDSPAGIIDYLSTYKHKDSPVSELNKEYSSFVRKYYTEVSDSEVLNSVYRTISEKLYSEYEVQDDYRSERIAATAISEYLSQNYRYSLKPKALPGKDDDFIDFFLSKQKEGYCTYFASAGTMLMRKFGFPARYVEGFIVTPDDFGIDDNGHIHAQPTDRTAHAWCEVFLDDIGWVPLEFTPGFQGNNNPNEPDKRTTTTTSATTPSVSITTTTNASTTNITTDAGTTSAGSSKPASSASTTRMSVSGNDRNTPSTEENDSKPNALLSFLKASLIYIIVLAVTVIIFCIIRHRKLQKQLKLTTQEDKAQAFVWIYIYYLRYLELINISDDSNISDEQQALKLAEKCRKNGIEDIIPAITYLSSLSIEIHLSRNREISPEEYSKAISALNTLKNNVVPERLSFIGRYAAKWIYGLY